MKRKSIPGAVLGIIGAVFAIIGGLSLAFCAELLTTLGSKDYTWATYVLGLGGGVVGLVGAILDFSKPKIGGVFQFLSAAMIVVLCILMYFQWAMIVAMILLVFGAILSFAVQKNAE